jgi:hypothetical protein
VMRSLAAAAVGCGLAWPPRGKPRAVCGSDRIEAMAVTEMGMRPGSIGAVDESDRQP